MALPLILSTRLTRRFFLHGLVAGMAPASLWAQGQAFRLSDKTTQAIVGLADGWDSTSVRLQRYERAPGGAWKPAGAAWGGRLGASGLVWGRGLNPAPPNVRLKREDDKRAPAGVFGLGGACGYEADIARHPALPYFQVTERDLWVEDVESPHYNRHLRLERAPRTEWEKKQQMRQGDYSHSLKLFVLHNAPPRVTPGGGSAIFFHIWRAGGGRASIGCTTMAEPALREMIRWLDPARLPVYILLPREEYASRRRSWALP